MEIAFSGLVGYTCVFAVTPVTVKLLLTNPEQECLAEIFLDLLCQLLVTKLEQMEHNLVSVYHQFKGYLKLVSAEEILK